MFLVLHDIPQEAQITDALRIATIKASSLVAQ
jgi:hypothetical protein